jgi:RecA/RadA recombinase
MMMSLLQFTDPTIEAPQLMPVERRKSGLYSVDKAVGHREDGLPLRTIVEIYGNEHVGKSSVAQYWGARIREEGKVGIMDTEGALDLDYVKGVFSRAGFKGTVKVVDHAYKKRNSDKLIARPHEVMAQELADYLVDPDYNAIILDSLGMWIPLAEAEGDIGDAIMGRRAKAIAQFSRRCASHLLVAEDPKAVFIVNHVLANLSSRGHYTPGGKTKGYAANVRLYMWRNENFDDGCFQAKMKVEKLRFGGTNKDRVGQVFIIPGVGVAAGMTAVFDCVNLGLAKRESVVKYKAEKSGEVVWNSAGRIGTLIEAERKGDMKKFKPFFKLLEGVDDDDRAKVEVA